MTLPTSFEQEYETCSLRHPNSYLPENCQKCGSPLPVTKSTGKPAKNRRWCSPACRREFERNHVWRFARRAARRRDKWKCVKCGSKEKLQVHHQNPVWGRGYGISCRHHVDSLECQCLACHKLETKEQLAKRRRENGR